MIETWYPEAVQHCTLVFLLTLVNWTCLTMTESGQNM